MARMSIKSDPDAVFTITVKEVNNFQRGHKRSILPSIKLLLLIVTCGLLTREIDIVTKQMMKSNIL